MQLIDRIQLFFFFSSRRRHTRLVSDWSSDVCSSDLSEGSSTGRAIVIGPYLRARHVRKEGSSPDGAKRIPGKARSEEHTSELQSLTNLVCRLLLEKKKITSMTQCCDSWSVHNTSVGP